MSGFIAEQEGQMMTRRYFEVELGRVTVGYDIEKKVTLVRRWSLAARGPDDLSSSGLQKQAQREVERVLRESSEQALYEAAMAAYAVPGEFTTKFATGWNVFWQRFPLLVQTKGKEAANQFITSFEIGLVEDAISESGLVLEAAGGKASAQMYAKLYEEVGRQVGGDAGKALNQYFGLMNQYNNLLTADVKVQVPSEITDLAAEAVAVAKALEDAPQRLADLATALEEQFAATGQRLEHEISSAALQVGNINQAVARQLQAVGLNIDTTSEQLAKLVLGDPRLDLKSPIDGVAKKMSETGEQIFRDVGAQIDREAQAAIFKMEELGRQLQSAIDSGARDTVERLNREFDERAKEYRAAAERLGELEQHLTALNLDAAAQDVGNAATNLANQFNPLQATSNGAVQAVEARITKMAEDAARAAAEALERARQEAQRFVERTFGFQF